MKDDHNASKVLHLYCLVYDNNKINNDDKPDIDRYIRYIYIVIYHDIVLKLMTY